MSTLDEAIFFMALTYQHLPLGRPSIVVVARECAHLHVRAHTCVSAVMSESCERGSSQLTGIQALLTGLALSPVHVAGPNALTINYTVSYVVLPMLDDF
jgi:hypothetical protein